MVNINMLDINKLTKELLEYIKSIYTDFLFNDNPVITDISFYLDGDFKFEYKDEFNNEYCIMIEDKEIYFSIHFVSYSNKKKQIQVISRFCGNTVVNNIKNMLEKISININE